VTSDIRAYIEKLQQVALKPKNRRRRSPAWSAHRATSAGIGGFLEMGADPAATHHDVAQTIARRMAENWQTIPHVTQFADADFTRLNALRKQFVRPTPRRAPG
jgi:pyruvate/2-oxoglutarate dehydrogenase complex dihydrolipoamide acyltransferase (E2) component